MTTLSFKSEITQADMDAAFKFMDKRIRRHPDVLEGISASLFAVMFVVGNCLSDVGLPLSEVESMFEQSKKQVLFHLTSKGAQHPTAQ